MILKVVGDGLVGAFIEHLWLGQFIGRDCSEKVGIVCKGIKVLAISNSNCYCLFIRKRKKKS